MISLRRYLFFAGVLLVAVVGLGFLSVVGATTNAVYASWPAVFDSAISGPTILLILACVAIQAGVPMVTNMQARWPAHVRTRMDIRHWLLKETVRPALLTAGVALAAVLVWGAYVFGWVTVNSSELVDPSGYGTPSAVRESLMTTYPLYAAAGQSLWVFLAISAVWAGLHAALMSVMATLTAVLIRSRVIALILPAATVVGVSIVAEYANIPSASPVGMWVHPGGLMPVEMSHAVLPGVLMALLCGALMAVIVRRAPRLQRFA